MWLRKRQKSNLLLGCCFLNLIFLNLTFNSETARGLRPICPSLQLCYHELYTQPQAQLTQSLVSSPRHASPVPHAHDRTVSAICDAKMNVAHDTQHVNVSHIMRSPPPTQSLLNGSLPPPLRDRFLSGLCTRIAHLSQARPLRLRLLLLLLTVLRRLPPPSTPRPRGRGRRWTRRACRRR